MTNAHAASLALIGTLAVAPLGAQRLAPVVLTSTTIAGSAAPSRIPVPAAAPSHWLEGAVIGALITGALGASLAGGLCGDADSGGSGQNCSLRALGGFVIGAVPGFTIGGIVGGAIPKAPEDSTQ
jgi:hypothetical protein